jgi:hypothetical protein
MTIQNLDRKELENKIEEILNLLEKKGLIPTLLPEAKKELTKKVSETLINDPKITLSQDDLKNENVQKGLGIACVSELVPNHKFDYRLLFRKQLEIEPKELQKELTLLFTHALKLTPGYQNKTQMQQLEMEEKLAELSEKMTDKFLENNKEPLLNNDKVTGILDAALDLLSEQRRTLYGMDTHNPGGILKPVLEVTYGEQMGIQDLAATGDSFMAKRDAVGGIPDPLGIHMANLINYLADGNTTGYEQYLMESNIIPSNKRESPSPFHTTPSPFNDK